MRRKCTQTEKRLSPACQELLCCPICRAKLRKVGQQFECMDSKCSTHFPIIDGIPVLINEQISVYSLDDIIPNGEKIASGMMQRLEQIISRVLPEIGINLKAKANYRRLGDLLLKESASPRVLVIGGRILGQGMESLANNSEIELVESDVSFGPRTMLIFDAHAIPFEDGAFDGVIIQAVLEHVVDPYICSEEIYRVLKPHGVVYVEIPFMQQVHGAPYDFTRFTHLGLRRLFRRFQELDSGAAGGPGMALAWSYDYFLRSFTTSRILRGAAHVFASLTSFYLKYFDYFLINRPGTLDAASGYYFMGRKTDNVMSDQDLIRLSRGQA